MLRDTMTPEDVERITGAYFIEGPSRGRALSSFWTLLVLSAIIAGAGVIADSAATVIGAMIVAPLMRPILGAAAAIVLARRRQVVINLGLT
ncbi:MAG: TIGR00341 family protein, partial [Intrasporangiaceae bacterium]|nr:TIGR00341 family protein [Intrasporangiaceae bacterium]